MVSPIVVRKAEDDVQLTKRGSAPNSPRSLPSSPQLWKVPSGDRSDMLVDESVEGMDVFMHVCMSYLWSGCA